MPVVTLADEIANIDQRAGWVMFWWLADREPTPD